MADRPTLIELVREPPLAWIVLNHPEKLNAWSWESARQITAHAESLRFDDEIRAVIVRAEGRAFCAGVDLGMPEDRITGRSPAEKTRNYFERFRWVHERFSLLAELPQPVIMAIHGYCLGAGLEVAMMGDIRIAADDARFALPEPKVGVSIDAGGDLRLIGEIGAGATRLLAFTGRRIDAETALRLGIVQEVVPRDALREPRARARPRDRRQRAARGAGDQAHDQLPRAAGSRRSAALRGRQRRAAVHLRRHGAGLQGDGREADARVRGQVGRVAAQRA